MMKKALVTVAIPSHNHAKYIAKTIQSALDQTFQDFEILIVDDASTDNSLEVIKSFQDPRIRVIELKENLGVCQTSNICIENCETKYIALVASDDVMTTDKLEKQVSFMEKNPTHGAVFSGVTIIDENDRINTKKTNKYTKVFEKDNRNRFEWLRHFFHQGNCIAATTLLARTEVLKTVGLFDPSVSQAHDYDLWTRFCFYGYEIHIIHEKLLNYRELSNSMNMSSNSARTRVRLIFDNEKVLENYLTINSLSDFYKIFPSARIIKNSLTQEEEKVAIKYLLAMEAMKKNNPSYQQFLLVLIHSLYKNNDSRKILKDLFGFNISAYLEIISKNPLGLLFEEKQQPKFKMILKKLEKTTLGKLKKII
jgi:glycosyltransferase involved in cell wall biosynthesis